MNRKASWTELTPEERLQRFEDLDLPEEVRLNNREDKIELALPVNLLHHALDKMIKGGYVTFSIDIFHETGNAVIDAFMPRDHAAGEGDVASDFL